MGGELTDTRSELTTLILLNELGIEVPSKSIALCTWVSTALRPHQ